MKKIFIFILGGICFLYGHAYADIVSMDEVVNNFDKSYLVSEFNKLDFKMKISLDKSNSKLNEKIKELYIFDE